MHISDHKHSNKLYHYPNDDNAMLKRIAIRFTLLFFTIANIDTLVDWSLGLLDLLFDYLHLLLDLVEYSIENLLGLLFSTGHYQSEIIMVNGAIVFAIYLTYRCYQGFPQFIDHQKRNFIAAHIRRNRRNSTYWRGLNLISKRPLHEVLRIIC